MLNISKNSVSDQFEINDWKSFALLKYTKVKNIGIILFSILSIILILILFLPWTQNITTQGQVTTRLPDQRPQTIQSVIAGRIDKWYIQEGDYVEKGDTLIFIKEIKSEYFDPELVDRTSEQLDAKSTNINVYQNKVNSIDNQLRALQEGMSLKIQQLENKIQQSRNYIVIDSIELSILNQNLEVAENQYERTNELYDQGLKSLSDLQTKKIKLQELTSKVIQQENKLINQKRELLNSRLERESVEQDYKDKIAKAGSEKQSALSSKYESISDEAKLKNLLSNYKARREFYYIAAPQDGFISRTLKKGIGETVKEGEPVIEILPKEVNLAAEIFVSPVDYPLVDLGQKVNIRFDGFPAIQLSGWPETSTGVFSGKVVFIDKFIGQNGKFRILVSPNDEDRGWPSNLSIGAGIRAFILLGDVPIWYELWRKLNGFPANYYQIEGQIKENKTKEKPSIKIIQ